MPAFWGGRAITQAQPPSLQHSLPSLCCTLRGCARILPEILKIRSESEKRSQLRRAVFIAPIGGSICVHRISLLALREAYGGLLALREAYGAAAASMQALQNKRCSIGALAQRPVGSSSSRLRVEPQPTQR